MYMVSDLWGNYQQQGLDIQVLFIFIFIFIMLQNTGVLSADFTFAPDKLKTFLSTIRTKKIHNIEKFKLKKASIHKLRTYESEQAEITSENQSKTLDYSKPEMYVEQQEIVQKITNDKEQQQPQKCIINNPERKNDQKIGLPPIFQRNFNLRTQSRQKRSISQDQNARGRYTSKRNSQKNQDRNTLQIQQGCYSALSKKLLILDNNDIQVNKIQNESHKNKRTTKKNWLAARIPTVDSKVLQGIDRMKKLYQ